MKKINLAALILVLMYSIVFGTNLKAQSEFELKIEQITSGTKHHFFGYIGQCQTIPWNADGRYILGMEIDRIDQMPEPEDGATIMLIDTHDGNKIKRIDTTYAWNPQQGTMFYWNPLKPETQFFFNDRDINSGKVFTVLFDIEKMERVRAYRYDDTPIGNGGVAADGSAWLGLNYGRLARLRLVTGYPGALDWSKDEIAPENDGMFIVDIETGEKRLLVSYRQIEEKLKESDPDLVHTGLFINHTLWNRDCDRIYFFARAGWNGTMISRINTPFSIRADGTDLVAHDIFIGGHPEWAEGSIMIGRQGSNQILYDVQEKAVVGQLGNSTIFPDPEGDIALSPDGNWFVNGHKDGTENIYSFYRLSDSTFIRSEGIDKGSYSGNIRIDPAPRWNRTNNAVLVPGIDNNYTRQMFVIRMIKNRVSITSPVSGARYLQTDTISVEAEVKGFDDKIQKFELFIDSNFIYDFGSSKVDTFLTGLSTGTHYIKMKAIDEGGISARDSSEIFIGTRSYEISNSIVGEGEILLAPPGGTYVEGTEISVLATPESSYFFSGWSGDTTTSENPLKLTMNTDMELIANFISIGDPVFKVNFQPDDSQVPEGYLKDAGLGYGLRDNGYTYGWIGGSNNEYRDRGTPADVRYATLNHMQKKGDRVWEIEITNGTYILFLVMGDPGNLDQINTVNLENVVKEDPDGEDKFDEYTVMVEVTDKRLTISPADGADNAKICFIEISEIESTGIENSNFAFKNFDLKQNYPNPFNQNTEISFRLLEAGQTKLSIFNIFGENIATLVNERLTVGTHQLTFNAVDLPTGMYFYKLQSGDSSMVRKMLLHK